MTHPLSDALAAQGYDTLTPVQEAVTDPELQDADLLVSAQTGSGKTVGFGLAMAPTLLNGEQRLGRAAEPLALIVAPTRELAFQVKREMEWLYAGVGGRLASCVGGMDARDERRSLEYGAHIVVGTPGRLVDHIRRGNLVLDSLRVVVLDEADEMLDMGFREDLEFMLAEAPEDRRTLLFSATVPPMIEKLAATYQTDAKRISTISKAQQHADISYQALQVGPRDTENAIINVLRFHDAQNAIVFANTRAAVARLTARLTNRGMSVVSLSGELTQSERSNALQAMRDGRARVCVATDVAARGIDLPGLDLVIHAELPQNTEGLLHRSGRTGRAGRKGVSAMIVPSKSIGRAKRLLKWAKIDAEWTTAPGADAIRAKDAERLLAHEAWTPEATEDELTLAEKLVDQFDVQALALACLRLHRAGLSAPEEISDPFERKQKKDHADFGPSRWVSLSVGRDQKAEPKWLLPLLCRVGRLDKTAIGAIRVQNTESFVQLSERVFDGFMMSLDGGELEDGISVTALDNAPEFAARPPRKTNAPKPHRKGSKPPRKEGDSKYKKPSDRSNWKDSDGAHGPAKGKSSKPKAESKPKQADSGKPVKGSKSTKSFGKKSDTKPSGTFGNPSAAKRSKPKAKTSTKKSKGGMAPPKRK